MRAKHRKHLEVLRRRRDHLLKRIKGDPTLSYDKTEVGALNWAIESLEEKE